MNGIYWRMSFALVLIAVAAMAGNLSSEKPRAWHVVSRRPATSRDTAFVDRHKLLTEPEDPTNAPGPGSFRLLSVKAPEHTRAVVLLDQRTGDSTVLAKSGTMPRFSPDGRFVAFSLWKSRERPWNLVILDRKTGRLIEPPLGGRVSAYKRWSPDGKWLAIQSNPSSRGRCRLGLVAVPSGSVRWADSLDVFADYEFGWSPNSRNLAVARPERVDQHAEEILSADLWIISDRGRVRCLLDSTSDYVARDPKWVTDSTLLVEKGQPGDDPEAAAARVLLQIRGGRP